MINLMFLLIAAIIATIYVVVHRDSLNKAQVIDVYYLYFLVAGVGVIGTVGFIGHIFFANQVAEMIGWPTGSPFQFEVGCHDGAWALLGFLCIFMRGNFWTATTLGWSFFMLGATYGHVKQMLIAGNFAPYNAGSILPDFLVPAILLTCLVLRRKNLRG